jgi:hypothetical protein
MYSFASDVSHLTRRKGSIQGQLNSLIDLLHRVACFISCCVYDFANDVVTIGFIVKRIAGIVKMKCSELQQKAHRASN